MVEVTIHAVETTPTALVPGQDRSGRAEVKLHGTATDERVTQGEDAAARAEPVPQDNVIVHDSLSSAFSSSLRAL